MNKMQNTQKDGFHSPVLNFIAIFCFVGFFLLSAVLVFLYIEGDYKHIVFLGMCQIFSFIFGIIFTIIDEMLQ